MYEIARFDGEIKAVRRLTDSALISLSERSADHDEYIDWCIKGNTPTDYETIA